MLALHRMRHLWLLNEDGLVRLIENTLVYNDIILFFSCPNSYLITVLHCKCISERHHQLCAVYC